MTNQSTPTPEATMNEELRSQLSNLSIHWYKSVSSPKFELAPETVDEIMQLIQDNQKEAYKKGYIDSGIEQAIKAKGKSDE